MTSFSALGYTIEHENKGAVASLASSYKGTFWLSFFQWVICWFTELLPKVRASHAAQNRVFLGLVRAYKPLILDEYDEYEKQFVRWEEENCTSRISGSKEARELEAKAEAQARQLTQELEQKLLERGLEYKKLAKFDDLVFAYAGYIRTDAVQKYWDGIESFLVSRSSTS